jgi:SAM-dependent methyltransferase
MQERVHAVESGAREPAPRTAVVAPDGTSSGGRPRLFRRLRGGAAATWLRGRWDILLNSRLPGVHQLSHATATDRYPALFGAVAHLAGARAGAPRRILSFGCSSGEECATLARYFPDAEIVGADISPRVLRTARRTWRHLDRVRFVSTADLFAGAESFDLVFAMSVLCRHRDTQHATRSDDIYPFAQFEATAGALARRVRPGGMLVIFNANYRFEDTASADGFEPVAVDCRTDDRLMNVRVRLFAPDGLVLPDQSQAHVVFRRAA